MTTTPYPVSGKVYDVDRTVEGDVTVKLTNSRTGDTLSQTTNSSGEFVFDLANFTNSYVDNDLILIQAWKKDGSYNVRVVSSTIIVSGSSAEKNLYLRAVYQKSMDILGWNDIKQETYSEDLNANKIINVNADRVDMSYDSDGNCTQIKEYINGVRMTTDLTWSSGNCTKIEVS